MIEVTRDVIAMLCLTVIAAVSMCTNVNHDMLMLIVGGLISLGGAVVGSKAQESSTKAKELKEYHE